jgi:hypothetical protein
MGKPEPRYVYESTCHLVVDGVGHVWPNTKDNRELGKTVTCVLTEAQARRYGAELKKIGPAPDPQSGAVGSDQPATATETK